MSKLTVSQNSDGTWPESFNVGSNDAVEFKVFGDYQVVVFFASDVSGQFSERAASPTDPDYDYSGTQNATFELSSRISSDESLAGGFTPNVLPENVTTLEVKGGQ